MSEPPRPVVAEPSRRRPPRQRAADPVPIPEAPSRQRARTVRLQDVLAAHQRAVEERIEEGLQRIREAAVEAARVAAARAVEIARTPQGPDAGDVARSLLTYADERFQAMGLRLQRIEDAIRTLADRRGEPAGARAGDTERLAGLIRDLATTQREVVARLVAAQRAAISRLAAEQRAALEDLGRRTGRGVVAVARKLQEDLVEDIEGLRASVRSMHRTLAWEGMARASRRQDPPGEEPSTD
jgi:hypothetical protein